MAKKSIAGRIAGQQDAILTGVIVLGLTFGIIAAVSIVAGPFIPVQRVTHY